MDVGDDYYAYQELPNHASHMRILRLLPGTAEDMIICELSQMTLEEMAEQYVAVSYTWGTAESLRKIIVDGKRFDVRLNLYKLLRAFRRPEQCRTLWLDAICIDQSSLVERNHQVGLMGQIFSKAVGVDTWIDFLDTLPNDLDLQTMPRLAEEIRKGLRVPTSAEEDAICAFIKAFQRNAYWTRIWIVQELLLAAQIRFVTSAGEFDWEDMLSLLSLCPKQHVEPIRSIVVVRSDRVVEQSSESFGDLFRRFGHWECKFEIDKFYSLYGLVDQSFGLESPSRPTVDYSLCIIELLIRHIRTSSQYPYSGDTFTFLNEFFDKFSHFRKSEGACPCHREVRVKIVLPWRGRDDTPAQRTFSVFEEHDVHLHRWFEPRDGACVKAEDLGFKVLPDARAITVGRFYDGGGLNYKVTTFIEHHDDNSTKRRSMDGNLPGHLRLPGSVVYPVGVLELDEKPPRRPSLILDLTIEQLIKFAIFTMYREA